MKIPTQRTYRIRCLAAALSVGALTALAGCNADEATNPQGDAIKQVREEVSKIQKDDNLANQLPDKYKEAVRTGTTYTFPPMRYKEGDDKVGVEHDLMQAILNRLGTKMETTEVAFDGLIPALKANRVDLAVESFADLPERRKQVSFVDYYRSNTALEVKKGNPLKIEGLADMCGHSAAFQSGVESIQTAKKQSKQCEADGKKPIDIKLYETSNDATLAVANGRADATGNDYPAALNETKTIQGGNALELVDKPISSDYFYGFGSRLDDKQLQEAVKNSLQSLMEDGTYKKILEAYGVEKGAIEKTGINTGPGKTS